MVKTAQERLIIKKLVSLPLLRQCLSFAEAVSQPAPDLSAKSWLCLLLTLLWLPCCPKLPAGSCGLLSAVWVSAGPGLPPPSVPPQASETGSRGPLIKLLKASSGPLPCRSAFLPLTASPWNSDINQKEKENHYLGFDAKWVTELSSQLFFTSESKLELTF